MKNVEPQTKLTGFLKPKMRQSDVFTNSCSTPKILMASMIFLYPPPARRHRGYNKSKLAEHLRVFRV